MIEAWDLHLHRLEETARSQELVDLAKKKEQHLARTAQAAEEAAEWAELEASWSQIGAQSALNKEIMLTNHALNNNRSK